MKITFTGKAVTTTDREREYAEKKLQRLGRYFNGAREAHVSHATQRNWQIVEVQLDLDGVILRGEARTDSFASAIDSVTDKLEERVRRFKGKLRHHKGIADAPTVAALINELPEETGEGAGEEQLPTLVRRKRFAIKPMTVDEAALQMELLHHDFFAFLNADSGEVNVIYRRRDGNYGLLEMAA